MMRWLAGLFLLLMAVGVQAQTFPKLAGRVVDEAHLLSPEQVQQIDQLSAEVEKASTRQLVVATVPDLQGYPIEDYGYRLGREWGIGQKEANNGVILLVAPNERRVRIEVGYGLEPIMTDALSSVIVNQTIVPRFKEGDMGGGTLAGAQAIATQLKLPLEAAEQRAQQIAATQAERRGDAPNPAVIAFAVIVILCVVLPIVFGAIRGGAKGRRYRGGRAPVIVWGPSTGSGWGSGGGGSSWGGFSGGGGGGGFSGGGGSFGGGGASGGW